MFYIKKFETEEQYADFLNSENFTLPNLSTVVKTLNVKYNNLNPRMNAGDIVYWNGLRTKTISNDNWTSSLGTPIGVVIIPSGMLPDGKARMIGLKPVDTNGNPSNSHVGMAWGGYGTDTTLTNYTKVPTTDNVGSTSTGSNGYGYLPSDKFTGTQSFVDPNAKYYTTSNMIPSPYLGNDYTLNPEYCKELSGNNALSDFDGLNNTQTLVGLGSDYVAANAAWNYKDGVSDAQWYLPAMGELGFVMVRFNAINEALTKVGGVAVAHTASFWSSSEYSSYNAYYLDANDGYASSDNKRNSNSVRPVALV